uniref:DUF4142 domain-containing protein n=1 Tax=Nonomuraea pusilla TaxID=46177 RepID=UPI000ABCAA99|nr:DUF4142 domain-containing protein [Nonomuraea pusilla]
MRTHLTILAASAAFVVSGLAGCGGTPQDAANLAAGAAATPTGSLTPPSEQDKTWMKEIHQVNLAEIQAGRLGESKGTTKEIKSVGKMLVDDHTKLDSQVTQAASRLGIELPSSPNKDQKELMKKLEGASGKDFDTMWLKGMTKGHEQAIEATKKEVSDGSSQVATTLAKAAQPQLEDHLNALRKAQGD